MVEGRGEGGRGIWSEGLVRSQFHLSPLSSPWLLSLVICFLVLLTVLSARFSLGTNTAPFIKMQWVWRAMRLHGGGGGGSILSVFCLPSQQSDSGNTCACVLFFCRSSRRRRRR